MTKAKVSDKRRRARNRAKRQRRAHRADKAMLQTIIGMTTVKEAQDESN
jgi:hypothetical protein